MFVIVGHNHVVTGINWSHCGSRLVTSSDDKTAALWVRSQSDPVLIFTNIIKSTREGQVSKKVSHYVSGLSFELCFIPVCFI